MIFAFLRFRSNGAGAEPFCDSAAPALVKDELVLSTLARAIEPMGTCSSDRGRIDQRGFLSPNG